MRADARRNRDRIVHAAVDVFRRHGAGGSMQQIADAAGVSVGAVYRHFPDRTALVEHIGSESLATLNDTSSAALARAERGESDAFAGLVTVLRCCVALPLGLTHSLVDESRYRDPALPDLISRSNGLLLRLISLAQTEGTLRADFSAEQVLAGISRVVCAPDVDPDGLELAVLIDGLRTRDDGARPADPLSGATTGERASSRTTEPPAR